MGCPDRCRGYELMRDLNFKSGGSYSSGEVNAKWTRGSGWLPIGVNDSFYAEFDGNGFTISNLFVNRVGDDQPEYSGLFAGFNGTATYLNVVDVDVTGRRLVGAFAALNGGSISFVQANGSVSSKEGIVGGLVGENYGSISHSGYSGIVSSESLAGGLAGVNESNIVSSYAAGRVVGSLSVDDDYVGSNVNVGGFVGHNRESGRIRYSYATGRVLSRNDEASLGGFLGNNEGSNGLASNYWRREPPVSYAGVGNGDAIGTKGLTPQHLQEPTGYTDIYADWLIDLDNADGDYDESTGKDHFWDFGTSGDYPVLKVDVDGDGIATWWEGGSQHGRSAPTPTPTSTATATPTATPTATATATPTITPTPTHTAVPTATFTPTVTATFTPLPTATQTQTFTSIPMDTPVPTVTATHMPVPTDTPLPTATAEPTSTLEPTATPIPPTQTPVIIVVTATPSADAASGGGCNSPGKVPMSAAAANMLLLMAPLGVVGGLRWYRRKQP